MSRYQQTCLRYFGSFSPRAAPRVRESSYHSREATRFHSTVGGGSIKRSESLPPPSTCERVPSERSESITTPRTSWGRSSTPEYHRRYSGNIAGTSLPGAPPAPAPLVPSKYFRSPLDPSPLSATSDRSTSFVGAESKADSSPAVSSPATPLRPRRYAAACDPNYTALTPSRTSVAACRFESLATPREGDVEAGKLAPGLARHPAVAEIIKTKLVPSTPSGRSGGGALCDPRFSEYPTPAVNTLHHCRFHFPRHSGNGSHHRVSSAERIFGSGSPPAKKSSNNPTFISTNILWHQDSGCATPTRGGRFVKSTDGSQSCSYAPSGDFESRTSSICL